MENTISDDGKKRLKILRDYMDGPARKLDKLSMASFWKDDDENENICTINTYECGTAMCFAGHGPLAGLTPPKYCIRDNESIDWFNYSAYLIGREIYKTSDPVWNFLFHRLWFNSYDECVARADLVLNDKMPKEFNYWDIYTT